MNKTAIFFAILLSSAAFAHTPHSVGSEDDTSINSDEHDANVQRERQDQAVRGLLRNLIELAENQRRVQQLARLERHYEQRLHNARNILQNLDRIDQNNPAMQRKILLGTLFGVGIATGVVIGSVVYQHCLK